MMLNVLSSVLRLLLKIYSSWHMNKLHLLLQHFLDLKVLVRLFAFCTSALQLIRGVEGVEG